MQVVALAGGVGGAKLAEGLQSVVGNSLTVIVNTGDDFRLHGLHISPDLDTVMYTLAGRANPETGWGIAGDTFNSMGMLFDYGSEDWFSLGDRDLATHILRTQMIGQGARLSEVTSHLADRLGVKAKILPMTDECVATMLNTDDGEMEFQEYFVRRHWHPAIRSVAFQGIEHARPAPGAVAAVTNAELIVLCPSNPFVSIDPILSVRDLGNAVRDSRATKVAVSPIVGGEALKGPAAKMFRELGTTPSAQAVAERYVGLVDSFVVDEVDKSQVAQIEALGFTVLVTNTVMSTVGDRERLGRRIIEWATGVSLQ